MNKTLKTMLAIVAGAAAITACQKENIIEGGDAPQTASVLNPMTFTAYMEGQDPATKTSIDASHYALDQLYDVIWSSGDKIGVYDGAEENNGCQAFTLNSGAGSTNAEFIGNAAEADTYYAIYPYVPFTREEKSVNINDIQTKFQELAPDGDFWEFNDELEYAVQEYAEFHELMEIYMLPQRFGINDEAFVNMLIAYATGEKLIIKSGIERDGDRFKEVVIPSEQTVSEGQFVDPKAMLMIAKSDDASSLSFKNICAYIRVTPQFDCHAICVRSNNVADLAGTFMLHYNNGVPSLSDVENTSTSVCLTGTITAGNTYYIAVAPAWLGYSNGFTIEFLTSDKSRYYGRRSDTNLNLERSEVVNLGEFSTGGAWTYNNVPTSGNDGNGHNWKLVTPTLKLATETAIYQAKPSSAWGSDWTYPSQEDLTPITDGRGHSGVQIFGVGVLKYVEPTVITVNAVSGYIWLSETGQREDQGVLKDARNKYDFETDGFGFNIIEYYNFGSHYKYTK